MQERLSQLLDNALFESVIAGEVRALGRAGNLNDLFAGLIALASDVMAYRWLAFLPNVGTSRPLFLHTRTADRDASQSEAHAALDANSEVTFEAVD